MRIIVAFIIVIFVSLHSLSPSPTHAGIIDKIKSIYNTPEKVDDMLNQYEIQYENTKKQYEETQKALQEQQQKYEEAEQRAAEIAHQQQQLIDMNAQYRDENERLISENNELLQQIALLEQQQSDRRDLLRTLLTVAILLIVIILGYFGLIRVWRYLSWRKHHINHSQGPKL